MLDTAGFHAHGRVEKLGESLAGRRDGALIATHGGMRPAANGRAVVVDGSPESLAAACEGSLRRLKTDRIDLFYLSRVDPQVPVEDSVGKLAELVAIGKIRYIGLHGASSDQLRRAQVALPVQSAGSRLSTSSPSVLHRGVNKNRRTVPRRWCGRLLPPRRRGARDRGLFGGPVGRAGIPARSGRRGGRTGPRDGAARVGLAAGLPGGRSAGAKHAKSLSSKR